VSDCVLQDVDQYLLLENRKDAEVESVQLENIKLKNKLKKQEAQLKSKVCYLLLKWFLTESIHNKDVYWVWEQPQVLGSPGH